MMNATIATPDSSASKERGEELRMIMQKAVQNVLKRPETLRGPYVIRDADLKAKAE
jgi:hypothetical protein